MLLKRAGPAPETFAVPNSDIILVLRWKDNVDKESITAILLTTDAFVARKISIHGQNAPADTIFQHGTGDHPYTRLYVWSNMGVTVTWGQIRTLIDGLQIFLLDEHNLEYTYWDMYERSVEDKNRLGWGSIVESHGLCGPGNLGHNSTAKRALQLPENLIIPPLNSSIC